MSLLRRLELSQEQYLDLRENKLFTGSESVLTPGSRGKLYKLYNPEFLGKKERVRDFELAALAQPSVKLTSLPTTPIFVQDKLAGCVINWYHNYFDISGFELLDKKSQHKALRLLLLKIKELVDNNIYPIDINDTIFSTKSSNFMINLSGDLQITDLDGSSVVYGETKLDEAEKIVYDRINILLSQLVNKSHKKCFVLSRTKPINDEFKKFILNGQTIGEAEDIVDRAYIKTSYN